MNPTPEQELMQKIAEIVHDDDNATLQQHVILSDGLGAHVEEEEEEKVAEAASVEDELEPKTALAGLSLPQIMNSPEFQAGVQEKLAERLPEIEDAIEKVAVSAGLRFRATTARMGRTVAKSWKPAAAGVGAGVLATKALSSKD